MKKILLTLLALATSVGAAGAVLINGNQINPATAITISSETVTGNGFSVGASTFAVKSGHVLVGTATDDSSGQSLQVTGGINLPVAANLQIGAAVGVSRTGNNLVLGSGYSSMMTPSTFAVTANAFSVGTSTLAVTGGQVGVLTAAPAYPLDVNGTMRATKFYGVSGATETVTAALTGVGTAASPLGVDSSSVAVLASSLVQNFQLDGSSITKMGNGFNGASQLVKLDANKAAQLTGSITATTATLTGSNFSVGSTTFTVSNGQIGIWTASPTFAVDIATTARVTGILNVGLTMRQTTCNTATSCVSNCSAGELVSGGGCRNDGGWGLLQCDSNDSTTAWRTVIGVAANITTTAFCSRLGKQ